MSKKGIFIFVVIFLGALFLRYHNYLNTIVFDSDRAVVFLIADRVINESKIPLVGTVTALSPINILSPTYLYLITILFYFFRNETVVTLILSLLNLYLVIVIFLISREMFGIKIALLASLFFTFSFEMINYSRSIWQAHTPPFFVVLTFYFLLIAFKRKKFIFIVLSILSFFFSLVYVSPFLLFPSFFILVVFITLNLAKNKMWSILKLSVVFSFIFLIFYGPVLVFEFPNNFYSLSQIKDFLLGLGELGNYSLSLFFYLESVIAHMKLFASSVFLFNSTNLNLSMLFLVLFLVIIVNFKTDENYWMKIYSSVMLMVFLTAFLFMGTYQGMPYVHRLSSIYPFFFILFSYSVTKFYFFFIQQRGIFLRIIFFLPLLIISFYFINNCRAMEYFITKSFPPVIHQLKVANFINNIAQNSKFSLYVITPNSKSNYYSAEYWYFLEKIRHERLAKLNKEGNFINTAFLRTKGFTFLICKHFKTSQELVDSCLNWFKQTYNFGNPTSATTIDSVTVFTFKI